MQGLACSQSLTASCLMTGCRASDEGNCEGEGTGQRGPVVPSSGKPTARQSRLLFFLQRHEGPGWVQPCVFLGPPSHLGRPVPRASPDPRYSFTQIERVLPAGLMKDGDSLLAAALWLLRGYLSAVPASLASPPQPGTSGIWPLAPPSGWNPLSRAPLVSRQLCSTQEASASE